MIGGLTWHPATGYCDILAHFYPGANINAERAIVFLDGLHQMIDGSIILIWDNLRVHHSEPVKDYLLANAAWLQVANLPSYSPDLNPIEFLWSAWKRTHFANVCRATSRRICDILFENESAASDPSLLKGCLLASGLMDKADMQA